MARIDWGRYIYNFRIFKGGVYEVCRQAENLNTPPYAVNIFPVGGKENEGEGKQICVDGEVLLCTCKIAENGGFIARLYNPDTKKKAFSVRLGEVSVNGEANGGEVVSVKVTDEKAEVLHDCMPV